MLRHVRAGAFSLLSIPVTALFLAAAVTMAAGGEGQYVAAKILFPHTMFLTGVFGYIDTMLIVIAFVQYPLYGIFLDVGRSRKALIKYLFILSGAHALGVIGAFLFAAGTFTP